MSEAYAIESAPFEPVDAAIFRNAMTRLRAAVNLVTTDGVAGRYGIVASAVCSVTDAPPTLLACVNRTSGANAPLKRNGVMAINILSARHHALPGDFVAAAPDSRFSTGVWAVGATGSPLLRDAVAALDCRITAVHEVGTHSVFYAEVQGVRFHGEADGLIWFDRRCHRFEPQMPVAG